MKMTFIALAVYFFLASAVSTIFGLPYGYFIAGLDVVYLIAALTGRTMVSKFQMIVLYFVFFGGGGRGSHYVDAAVFVFILISMYDMLVNRKDDTGPVSSQ